MIGWLIILLFSLAILITAIVIICLGNNHKNKMKYKQKQYPIQDFLQIEAPGGDK